MYYNNKRLDRICVKIWPRPLHSMRLPLAFTLSSGPKQDKRWISMCAFPMMEFPLIHNQSVSIKLLNTNGISRSLRFGFSVVRGHSLPADRLGIIYTVILECTPSKCCLFFSIVIRAIAAAVLRSSGETKLQKLKIDQALWEGAVTRTCALPQGCRLAFTVQLPQALLITPLAVFVPKTQ